MKKTAVAASAAFALFATSAFADGSHQYFTAEAGQASLSSSTFNNPNTFGFTVGSEMGNPSNEEPRVALELSYVMFAQAYVTNTVGAQTGQLALAQTSYHLAGVYSYPLGKSGLDLTARGGIAFNASAMSGSGLYAATNSSASNTGLTYGLGIRYNFTDGFAMNLRYDAMGSFAATASGGNIDESRLGLGLQFSY